MNKSWIWMTLVIMALVAAACQPAPQMAQEGADPLLTAVEETSTAENSLPENEPEENSLTYPLVATGQAVCYDNTQAVACPAAGQPFYGQDAQYSGSPPSYQDHGDGTVTDRVTGLMWAASPDLNGDGEINIEDKLTYAQAQAASASFDLAGYDDWRLPTIKELYSLILFTGEDPSGLQGEDTSGLTPFIDTSAFAFGYGDTSAGERAIDAQFATNTLYTSTTMGGAQTMFGVNFADGRIKGYPVDKAFYVYFVRGAQGYGINAFEDNGDGTVSDLATGLMWAQDDSGEGMDWESALAWVQEMNAAQYLGYSDWRLPNAKELQSIVDYSRSPDATRSAALDPLFNITAITNEAGQMDFPAFWTATTHASSSPQPGMSAVYVAFGRAMGKMRGIWLDVHGAGAQRSDPKAGDAADYPDGRGPQGDAIRIENFVRLVRDR